MLKTIIIPKTINIKITKKKKEIILQFINSNGTFFFSVLPSICIIWKKSTRTLFFLSDSKKDPFLSLTVKLILNSIGGLIKGYTSNISLLGRGFKYNSKHNDLKISLGFSHGLNIKFNNPTIVLPTNKTDFRVLSLNNLELNKTVFFLQQLKKLDSYKGKGICINNKFKKLKEGKKKMY